MEAADHQNATFCYDEYFEWLYGDARGTAVFLGETILYFLVGPVLWLGIAVFRAKGVHQLQGTAINQLDIASVVALVGTEILKLLCRMWRILVGPLTPPIALYMFCNIATNFMIMMTILLLNASYMLRYIYVVVWKSIRPIQEDFWAAFSIMIGVLMALALAFAAFVKKSDHSNLILLTSECILPGMAAKPMHEGFILPMVIGICLVIQTGAFIHAMYIKLNIYMETTQVFVISPSQVASDRSTEEQPETGNSRWNLGRNLLQEAMSGCRRRLVNFHQALIALGMNWGGLIGILCVLSITGLNKYMFALTAAEAKATYPRYQVQIRYAMVPFCVSILMPLLVYAANKKLRSFMFRWVSGKIFVCQASSN